MTWIDARIPVRFGTAGTGRKEDATLVEGRDFEAGPNGHAVSCGCCLGRSPVAIALDRLFQRRVRGEVPFFRAVLVTTESAAAEREVRAALQDDQVVSARFRSDPG